MKKRHPKGILIPIGGGEDKKDKKAVLNRFIQEIKRKSPKVCVITVASGLGKEIYSDYKHAFKEIGHSRLSHIHFDNRADADTKINLEKIKKCDAVLFSGGNQLKLSSLMGGTKLIELIFNRYMDEPQFVVAGTSAGAAAMSDTMIISGSSTEALIKGELELTNGLDLIDKVFIDTHFTERGRFGRLIQTVTCNPGVLGLGLGEDTAVVIYDGVNLEVIGSGLVVIADGSGITYTDLTDIENGNPITVEGVKISILGPGKRFRLDEKKLMNSEK